MRNFREYDIWKDSMIITKDIYLYTKGFPKQDAIINQMQRAAISIPSNIAEGSSRKSSVEFARYIEIALGSAYELETQIELSFLLHYINNDIYKKLISNVCSVEKRMSKFILTLREK
jgi:four helix bundle protein